MSKKHKHKTYRQDGNAASGYQNKPTEESPQEGRKTNVILDEISVVGSQLYRMPGVPDFNPDQLVGRKGLEIYKTMRDDDQIKAVLTMKKMAMLSTGWDVYPASEDPEDVEKKDFIKWNIDNLDGTIEDYLWNIFTAYDFGFCLHGDTVIHSPEGDRPIRDFVGRQPWVYSWSNGQLKIAKAKRVWLSQKNVPCIKVTYEWWSHGNRKEDSVICTKSHPFLMRDGKYIKAGELKIGDRLSYFSQKISTPGPNPYKRHRAYVKTNGFEYGKSKWTKRSHWVWEQIHSELPEGHVIHHIDDDTLNDSPDNLCSMPRKGHNGHSAMHSNKWFQEVTPERLSERNKRLSITANLPEQIQRRSEAATLGNLRTWKDPIIRQRRIKGIIRAKAKNRLFVEQQIKEDNHRIISIEPCGLSDVYDMEVPEYHNFAANHVFVHNSVSEIVFYRIEKGRWAGKIGLKSIKTREPFYYSFNSDVHGNLRENGIIYLGGQLQWAGLKTMPEQLQNLQDKSHPISGIELPINKFIIYSYQKEFSNHFGKCFSCDTEILTLNGWKFVDKVDNNDEFATLNPGTNMLEYQKASRFFDYDFNGKMFHQSGKSIDLMVTPNHKMWVRTENTDKFRFIEARYLPRYVFYKRDTNWKGEEKEFFELGNKKIKMNDWLKFFGIWIAEGCAYTSIVKKKDGRRYFYPLVLISQKKGEKLEIIKGWILACGFKFYEDKRKDGISTLIIRNEPELYSYLKQFGRCEDKFLPIDIKRLCSKQLSILYDAMAFGDDGDEGKQYASVSKKLIDDVSEILLKTGYVTTIGVRSGKSKSAKFNYCNYKIWVISISKPSSKGTECNKTDKRKWVDYSGKVYCVEVPNHLIYVRRNGKACWCGNSDLKSSYRSWFSKEILIRFYNIYMERFGMPTHVGTFPRGTSKADREDLRTVLDRVQSKYSIVIPEDVKIELLRAEAGGAEGYARAIELHNKFIARSVLVPDLMGYTEMSSGGAYALGKKHFDMFIWIIKKGHRDVQETIMGEQVIKRLIDMNWLETENYPQFKFESVTEEGSQAKATIVANGLQSGFINPQEAWIRDYLGLPAKAPDIELPTIPLSPVRQQPVSEEVMSRLKGLEEKVQEFREFKEAVRRKIAIDSDKGKKTIVHFQDKKKRKIEVKPSQFTKKMDYVEVKQSLDDYEDETVNALSMIITEMRDDLIRRVRRKKLIENKDLTAINKLQVKYIGDFKRELEKRALKLYVDGKIEAAKMIKKGGVNIDIVTKFQSVGDWEPVPPADAIDFFKKKVLVKVENKKGDKVLINLLTGEVLDYYTQKAFYIAGIEKEEILKQAKASLLNSLKEGHSVDHAVANLGNVFDKYIERGELNDAGDLITAHRLETIVRTNFSEAYNRGLRDFIDDNDITDFVPAWEYSAILDDRVRESHAAVDSMIFREDDPLLERITPPNGYNALLKGERVLTNTGYIPIEKIEVGNEVLTHEGRYKKVIETMSKFWDKGYYLLTLEDGKELRITEDHPVLTNNKGWILMKDLDLRDDIITVDKLKMLDKSF